MLGTDVFGSWYLFSSLLVVPVLLPKSTFSNATNPTSAFKVVVKLIVFG